ncbi:MULTISPECIES: NAD-dependent protein deacetylase [Luteibacter]|uniref:NAD-dependent protein deacetylase n=1 Tax=Luteibacter TaxID=242605 RepID=UPI0009DD3042|nr:MULTISPECIES: NAD-dependent protein deacetylase [unclassified Luteibacter]
MRFRCCANTAERSAIVPGTVSTLHTFIDTHPRLFVLTGAGISTDSGIPDYRDGQGAWKRSPPMTLQMFMSGPPARARYWARGMIGWRHFSSVSPNLAHRALARMEHEGRIELLLTQNVDGLHEAAGSINVVDLHGRLDRVRCMQCGDITTRATMQARLEEANPAWLALQATVAPDGDADLDEVDFSAFVIPTCTVCGGILKPDVVFFGENVPRARVDTAWAHLARADAMLVVGSSLMVYSGYRFVLEASRKGLPIASVNLGVTRADALIDVKIEQSVTDALAPYA